MTKQPEVVTDNQRLDKWLWVARFYKTRSLAVEAVNGGKVHLNSQRVKPGHIVKQGHVLTISKPPYEHVITVLDTAKQRRPAAEAQLLYVESEDSVAKREELKQILKDQPLGLRHDKGRPNKRDRRHIIKFTRKE